MKRTQKRLWLYGLIALATIILLTVIIAPFSNIKSRGSTYNRSPDGYGAWYSIMEGKGWKIGRWQKPLKTLLKQTASSPVTLVRIDPSLGTESVLALPEIKPWVKQGNRLILLGVPQTITEAPYHNSLASPAGTVQIDTRRRNQRNLPDVLLQDTYGAVLWREKVGLGEIISSTAPYLAANAYQDSPGNYQFFTELVTEKPQPIWVDEYTHGYRDAAPTSQTYPEPSEHGSWWGYFLTTPLFPPALQGMIILGIAIWAGNRRWRRPTPLVTPAVNNSAAYIQGLAAVLHKAECSEFVLKQITPAEQLYIQQQLGLGNTLLDAHAFLEVLQENQISARDFQSLLDIPKHHLKDHDLKTWLERWQKIRLSLKK